VKRFTRWASLFPSKRIANGQNGTTNHPRKQFFIVTVHGRLRFTRSSQKFSIRNYNLSFIRRTPGIRCPPLFCRCSVIVLSTPTLSAGNPGAASLTLLGLRRIAILQESGRRRTSVSKAPRYINVPCQTWKFVQYLLNDALAGARTPRGEQCKDDPVKRGMRCGVIRIAPGTEGVGRTSFMLIRRKRRTPAYWCSLSSLNPFRRRIAIMGDTVPAVEFCTDIHGPVGVAE